MSGDQKTDACQKIQAQISGYLIGAAAIDIPACDRLASGIAGIVMKYRERDELSRILAGLKLRGVITQEDVDRLDRDEMKEV